MKAESNFESFEEFKTFISGVLVTAIPAVSYANAQGLYCLKATGDACGGLRLC